MVVLLNSDLVLDMFCEAYIGGIGGSRVWVIVGEWSWKKRKCQIEKNMMPNRNNLSTFEVEVMFAYTLSSPDPTFWDYTGYVVV